MVSFPVAILGALLLRPLCISADEYSALNANAASASTTVAPVQSAPVNALKAAQENAEKIMQSTPNTAAAEADNLVAGAPAELPASGPAPDALEATKQAQAKALDIAKQAGAQANELGQSAQQTAAEKTHEILTSAPADVASTAQAALSTHLPEASASAKQLMTAAQGFGQSAQQGAQNKAKELAQSIQSGVAEKAGVLNTKANVALEKLPTVGSASSVARSAAAKASKELLPKFNVAAVADSLKVAEASLQPEALRVVADSCSAKFQVAKAAMGACVDQAPKWKKHAYCLCIDSFNISMAACEGDETTASSIAETFASHPEVKTCSPWVEETGSKSFAEVIGSLKLTVSNSSAFEALTGKATAIESAVSKLSGVAPKYVSAVLFPFVTSSRRLQATGSGEWLANYSIAVSMDKAVDAAGVASKLETTTPAKLEDTLTQEFVSVTGSDAGISGAEALPVEINEVPLPFEVVTAAPTPAPTVYSSTTAEAAPVVPVETWTTTTTASPEGGSWFSAHWLHIVFVSVGVALIGVCCIAGAICFGQKAPKKSKKKTTRAAVNPASTTASGTQVASVPSYVPVPTLAAPLPAYAMPNVQQYSQMHFAAPQAAPAIATLAAPATVNRGMPMMPPYAGAAVASPDAMAAQANALFDMLDRNHTGHVSFQDFEALMSQRR
eukprot:TRINITY_DN18964_c0_g1_i1.p1 TRINITY_DN18964_c0_g1~~TRINITY_DN18964_c0_g1_i1.p1  ORF type:complete len:672 (+),score=119.77 TRINITY_DN18964_c0_g1_i1:59-2074(+)